MMRQRLLQVVPLLVVAAALLEGCGFRPRGALDLPADVRSLHMQAPHAIADEIQIFLDGEKIDITDTAADADITIAVTSERFSRRVTAVNPATGKEQEFEIVYTVDFNVRRSDGTMVIPPRQLGFRRDYVFDPTTVLGDVNQEQVLREEMRSDAANAIVRALEAALAR